MERKAFIAVLVTLLVWSSAFAGIQAGLHAFTPGHLLLLRFLTASVTLGVYAAITKIPLPPPALWLRLFAIGFVGITLYMAMLTFGERTVPAGTAGFIVAASPVFTALFAARLLREPVTAQAGVGIGIGLAGEAVIAFGLGHIGSLGPSVLLVVGSAVATALFFILEKPYLARFPTSHVTTWVTWAGTLPFLIFLPGFAHQVAGAPAGDLIAILYLGVVPAAFGYVLWAYAMSRVPTNRVMSFLYIEPLLAAGIAWVWLGEVPGWNTWVGGALVLCGVLVVNRDHGAAQTRAVRESPHATAPATASRPS